MMKETPIIMTGDSVRAIMEGRKTQTRQWLHPQPKQAVDGCWYLNRHYANESHLRRERAVDFCLYQPGDRLWVKETWGDADIFYQSHQNDCPFVVAYKADYSAIRYTNPPQSPPKYDMDQWNWDSITWRSPLFMPQWASRITLVVTEVRVQQIQEIGTEDARAEGYTSVEEYSKHWNQINSKKYPWESNPWIRAITFQAVVA